MKSWRVLSVTDVGNEELRDSWRNLAEIHAAPSWLWAALVEGDLEAMRRVREIADQLLQAVAEGDQG